VRQLERTFRAASKIPFYAERFGAAPRPANLHKLPMLKRSEVEALSLSVRSLYPPGRRFVSERSSGTSGVAVKLLFDSSHQLGRNAARIRFLRMHGWNPLRSSVWLMASSLVRERNPDYQGLGELIRWFSSALGVKFLSTSMPFREQVESLARSKAVSVYAFPHSVDGILRTLEETGQRLPSLSLLMCGGEVVDDSLRERTRRQLGLELRDNYGSTEAFLAFQCPAGSYHINAEHVLLEVVDEAGGACAAGQMGRVLVTTLQNYLMPLVRYEIGDYAIAARGGCLCGRTLPLLGRVVGREVNLFRKPDGSLMSGWSAVGSLRNLPILKTFQLVQKSSLQFCVRYVADRPLTRDEEATVRSKFRNDLWELVEVTFEHVTEIKRAASGKFMLTSREVPVSQPRMNK
jgi:phenylacetate-CoA ligase